ncbi:uncharacterized protein PV09_01207 [Verruconis gallopava]|uniref:S1/P1 Nuclease n=1 Tax=Verruconis gallopava TaxID=253628 RepID=A0A0D2BAC9_9PEZI|nr:uncharacterized protein PV09_01207 [Verruconis gallopava]KIW08289.1 hypothetical protein PV09_01207 [Verruconis gallopava]
MRLLRFTVLLTALLQHALGWGGLGHQTVAYLAYEFLGSDTRSYLEDLLANNQGFDFADAATWPDAIRNRRPYSKPWHYIDGRDSPPSQCGIKYPDDCGDNPEDGCIITAIANQTAIFTDTSQPDNLRKEALMYLMHFIGDIHQPLHTEDAYRGGNELDVCFGRACSRVNLHSVWDTYIPHKIVGLRSSADKAEEKSAAKSWADKLFGAAVGVHLVDECHDLTDSEKCSLLWARETNRLVCSYVLKKPIDWLESHDLSQEYYEGAKPLVEKAITAAGVRLAGWLEAMVQAVSASETGNNDLEL